MSRENTNSINVEDFADTRRVFERTVAENKKILTRFFASKGKLFLPLRFAGEKETIDVLNVRLVSHTPSLVGGAVYFHKDDYGRLAGKIGIEPLRSRLAVASIVHHETSHRVQEQLQIDLEFPKHSEYDDGVIRTAKELHADCIAGILARESMRSSATDAEMRKALHLIGSAGDPPEVRSHGTSEMRRAAFIRGLRIGTLSKIPDIKEFITIARNYHYPQDHIQEILIEKDRVKAKRVF